MTIRILHAAGDFAPGQIVTMPDRRALGLIATGYAERVADEPAVEQAMEQVQMPPRGRRGRAVETR